MKRYVIPYDYPDMDSSLMHIYLLEAGDRLLAGMSQDSSKKHTNSLPVWVWMYSLAKW